MTDEEFVAELRAVFAREASGYLERLRAGLPHLSDSAVDPLVLRDLSLAAHSLRGASRSIDFEEMEMVSHALEDLFDGWIAGLNWPIEAIASRRVRAAVQLLGELLRDTPSAFLQTPSHLSALRALVPGPGAYAWS